MKRRHSTFVVIALMLATASATLLLSILGFQTLTGAGGDLHREIQQIRQVREVISNRYVGEFSESDLTDAALAATVAALGDPWSAYLTAEAFAAELRNTQNQHRGMIGITFDRDEETNHPVIVSVTPGGPADEAGLNPGDTILTLEGQNAAELETEIIRQMIGDRYGYSVILELRNPAGALRTAEIFVRQFFVSPVTYEKMEDSIGYIRIANFNATSAEETIAAIDTLLETGAESLIFDVRSNPGGGVYELLAVLDYLLPEGDLFVYLDPRGGEVVRRSGPDYLDIPIVVLVNEHSFSAAEFFAAILQEYEWAEIVGMPTSGKSRSQVTIPLMGGGAIRLSTNRYFTSNRVDLYETGGIRPDHQVEQDETENDIQLEAALTLLR
ncbi:MAG: S41 family peptidase [Oscillospiraceae bacterium]|nr:S41 family peptidase [Oscillospiraceae bacterium]